MENKNSQVGKYSQAGQDEFVLSFFDKNYKGVFVDVGCYKPEFLNNTIRLEEQGWKGISIDILKLEEDWKIRDTPFVSTNALTCDYSKLFNSNDLPKIIDYLSLDIEGDGQRFVALKKVFESGRVFKIITIEHDSYRGYEKAEKIPQRKFLKEKGYHLLCSDVTLSGNAFEDWWLNPNFIEVDKYKHLVCNNTEASEIINKII